MLWWYLIRRPEPWQLHLLQLCCWSVLGWVIPPDLSVPQLCPQCSNYARCLLTAAPFWGCRSASGQSPAAPAAPFWGCRGLAWCWPPASLLEESGLDWAERVKTGGIMRRGVSWQVFCLASYTHYIHTHLAELTWGFSRLSSQAFQLCESKGKVFIY